jgi:BioD-like phosphotransacetylase family protein
MATLQVVSTEPRSGKSTVAAALALGLARAGRAVTLLRAGDSESARHDAEAFSALSFASAPSEPVQRSAIPDSAGITIVELDAGIEPLDAPAVMALTGAATAEDKALSSKLGGGFIGAVCTDVPASQVESTSRELTNAGLRPLAVIPEDRALASPSVEDIRHALAADVLYEGENLKATIENLLVAPVYTDGAKMHFRRHPGTRAVLTPSYKTDLLLAAIEAEAACLVVTGGHQPSHYVIDRAQGEPVTVLLAQHQTPAAVAALAGVWGASAFAGEREAEAAYGLIERQIDWQALAKKLD